MVQVANLLLEPFSAGRDGNLQAISDGGPRSTLWASHGNVRSFATASELVSDPAFCRLPGQTEQAAHTGGAGAHAECLAEPIRWFLGAFCYEEGRGAKQESEEGPRLPPKKPVTSPEDTQVRAFRRQLDGRLDPGERCVPRVCACWSQQWGQD